jgi:hypothetical protein
MTTGQKLNDLEYILDRLLDKVAQKSLDLMAKGGMPKVDDTKYHDFWNDVAKFQGRLVLIMRELDTIAHNLDFRSQIAKRLPREFRYRANQSIRDLRNRQQQVYEKAARVEEILRDLYFGGQKPTRADIIKAIEKLAKEGDSALDKLAAKTAAKVVQEHGPSIDGLTQPNPVMHGVPIVMLITLIYTYIRNRSKRPAKDDES